MTCVAAIADGKDIWMMADTLYLRPETGQKGTSRQPKIWNSNGVLFGAAGDVRFDNQLRYQIGNFTAPLYNDGDPFGWVISTLIPKIQKIENLVIGESSFLIGIKGRLIEVGSEWEAVERDDHDFMAIGSCADLAMGVLELTSAFGWTPRARLDGALRAACALSAYAAPPFTYLTTSKEPETDE